jgi:hypothetical protein
MVRYVLVILDDKLGMLYFQRPTRKEVEPEIRIALQKPDGRKQNMVLQTDAAS